MAIRKGFSLPGEKKKNQETNSLVWNTGLFYVPLLEKYTSKDKACLKMWLTEGDCV